MTETAALKKLMQQKFGNLFLCIVTPLAKWKRVAVSGFSESFVFESIIQNALRYAEILRKRK